MADLKTTYKDDVLNASVNTRRKYNMIQNDDGTVSFEDVTVYSQIGDTFGAGDMNAVTEAVNNKLNRTANGSSSDLGVMPYYTFKKYWASIPRGFSCGTISFGMGYYIGVKDSETDGFFLIQARHDLNDDALRVSGGVYLVNITNGEWTLDKITTENLFFE